MHRDSLIRASGLAAIICGALTVVFWLFHPVAGDPSAPHGAAYWEALTGGRYAAVNAGFLIIILTSLLALPGFYARQYDVAGRSGFVGFVLAFLGTALFIGPGVFQAFIAPVLASDPATRPLLEQAGPLLGGPLAGVFAGGGMIFALGYIVFGISIARAGRLPRAAGVLLAVSSPILGLSPLMPLWARALGSALWGLANIWMGYALASTPWPVASDLLPSGSPQARHV
jgi:hypothetical protein